MKESVLLQLLLFSEGQVVLLTMKRSFMVNKTTSYLKDAEPDDAIVSVDQCKRDEAETT